MKGKIVILSLFLGIFHYTINFAQSSSDSLMHYLEIATKSNPAVLQKYNEYLASLEKIPQAGALQDPELSLGIFLSPMEVLGGNQVADIRLMQMFPWFGVRKNAKDEMSLMAKAKYENFREVKLQVVYDVQRNWLELNKNKQEIRISEKNLDILKALERIAMVKFKTAPTGGVSSPNTSSNRSNSANQSTSASSGAMGGMNDAGQQTSTANQSSSMSGSSMGSTGGISGLADLYQIQIEMAELENNTAMLRNKQATLVAKFNTYLNREVQSQIFLPDTLDLVSDLNLLSGSDSLLVNNPMLGMIQYESQSLDARKMMVSKMSYPMVGLGLNYSLINKNEMSASPMNGEDMIMPMVTFTLPIYRKKYKAMQKEAELLKISNEYAFHEALNSLKREYQDALQLYLDSERRIKLYEKQSLLANSSLNIIMKSFSVSGSGLTEVLRVLQQTLDFEFKRIEAVSEFNLAVAMLKRLGMNNNLNELK